MKVSQEEAGISRHSGEKPGHPCQHRQPSFNNLEFAPGQLHVARGQWKVVTMPPLGLDYFSFFEGKEGTDSEIAHRNCDLKFDRQSGDKWAQ